VEKKKPMMIMIMAIITTVTNVIAGKEVSHIFLETEVPRFLGIPLLCSERPATGPHTEPYECVLHPAHFYLEM
jgi:hypothetical protein